ncbi:MAG: hypothetical protein ACPGOY_16565 [Rhodospirillaceae bacterium]
MISMVLAACQTTSSPSTASKPVTTPPSNRAETAPAAIGAVEFKYAPMPRTRYQRTFDRGPKGHFSGPLYLRSARSQRGLTITVDSDILVEPQAFVITDRGKVRSFDLGFGITNQASAQMQSFGQFFALMLPEYRVDPQAVGDIVASNPMGEGTNIFRTKLEFVGRGYSQKAKAEGYDLKYALVDLMTGEELDVGRLLVDEKTFMPIDLTWEFQEQGEEYRFELYRLPEGG